MLDCVVVGGGCSGLTAAYELLYKYRMQNILLLEGNSRLGGRIYTQMYDTKSFSVVPHETYENKLQEWMLNGFEWNEEEQKRYCFIEHGASWVGLPQVHLQQYIEKFGLKTYKQYEAGNSILELKDGKPQLYSGTIPPVGVVALADLKKLMWKINNYASYVPLEDPFKSSYTKDYDSISVHQFLEDSMWTAIGKEVITTAIETVFSVSTQDISLLSFLHHVRSGNGLEALISTGGGAQDSCFTHGSYSLPFVLKSKLPTDLYKLNQNVTKITKTEEGQITVTCAAGEEYTTKRVILALPPLQTMKIEMNPPFPFSKAISRSKIVVGHTIKVHLIFKTKWWRDKGFSGMFLTTKGFFSCGYDFNQSLLLLIVGDKSSVYRGWDDDKKISKVIEELCRLFEQEEEFIQSQLVHKFEMDWVEQEYHNAAFEGALHVNAMDGDNADAMNASWGPIHFAGTETASQHIAYVSGAIESGQRAAKEVYDSLSK